MGSTDKSVIHERILESAVYLDLYVGHKRWSIAQLARRAQITRTLIYYYFGSEKMKILLAAVEMIGQELLGLSFSATHKWEAKELHTSVEKARLKILQYPHFITFYFIYRSEKNELSNIIAALEKQYVRKLQSYNPNLTEEELEASWAFLFGAVTAPPLFGGTRDVGIKILVEQITPPTERQLQSVQQVI